MKKVSIIVPVYNSSKYLKDCLESLVNQTLNDIEIITIDDGSTDNSLKILNDYQNIYKNKIKVLVNKSNHGQSYTRNLGIKEANGEYIGFVDSDDFVHPKMYETLYDGAVNNGYPKIVSTRIIFIKENNHYNNDFDFIKRNSSNIYVTEKNPDHIYDESPSCCNKIFRSNIIKSNPFIDVNMWEDIAFTYSKLLNTEKILTFPNSDYFYRKHDNNSVSANGSKVNINLLNIFTVADELNKNCKLYLKEQAKLLQVVACLGRISEILKWDISKSDKIELIKDIDSLICQKYGDWRKLDQSLLSMRINTIELEFIGLTQSNTITNKNQDELKQKIYQKLISFK